MADVYKFRVKLQELDKYLWRDIEVSSLSTMAKLGYAILASFQAQGSHLFGITYDCFRYEFDYEGDVFDSVDDDIEDVIPPNIAKVSSLKLKIGDKMEMEYDYGAGWTFDIELISIEPMVKGTGTHYPYITDGAGWGIIEDTCPGELMDYIKQIDKTGVLPKFEPYSMPFCTAEWDYRRFDIETINALLKGEIQQLQDAYEESYCIEDVSPISEFNDAKLLGLANKRMQNFNLENLISSEDLYKELGITEDDLEAIDELEFE